MPKRSAEVEEVLQAFKEDIEESIDLSPQDIREFVVSNEVQRTLAHLIGRTAMGDRKPVEITDDRRLKVVSAGAGYEEYGTESGSASDTYAAADTYEFSDNYLLFDILIESNDAEISFQNVKGQWLDDIVLTTGFHSLEFIGYGIRIQNRTAGNTAGYNLTYYR